MYHLFGDIVYFTEYCFEGIHLFKGDAELSNYGVSIRITYAELCNLCFQHIFANFLRVNIGLAFFHLVWPLPSSGRFVVCPLVHLDKMESSSPVF